MLILHSSEDARVEDEANEDRGRGRSPSFQGLPVGRRELLIDAQPCLRREREKESW